MRPDRLITLNLVQPCRQLASWLGASNTSPDRCLPVLMYHSISESPEAGMSAYYQTVTHPKIFGQQMAWLKTEGFQGVDLSTGLAWLESTSRHSNLRPVVITFDDGFRDFYTEAFPALREQGFSATMFLATGFISQLRRRFKGTECLTWDEVCELDKAGMQFGSHTVSHPTLTDLSWSGIEREIRASKDELEQRLGRPVKTFAYPFAFPQNDLAFRKSFRTQLVQAGYDCCVTTEIGLVKPGNDPYGLKRLPVNSLDDVALLRAKLAGAYDWLAWPQGVIKKIKYLARGSKVLDQETSLAGHSTTGIQNQEAAVQPSAESWKS